MASNMDKAHELYKKGTKVKDIAKKFKVAESTVRSWKHRQNWDGATVEKKRCDSATKKKSKYDAPVSEIKSLLTNEELTEKQRLFCIYFVKSFNQTRSYMKAYGCGYAAAAVSANALLKNPKIVKEIKILKSNKFNREYLTQEDIVQRYIDIAYSDITDYVEFGMKTIKATNDDGIVQEFEIPASKIVDSKEVDGRVITEFSANEKGIKIKLDNSLKALEWLSNHMDIATTEQKLKIDKMQREIELLEVRKKNEQEGF